MMTENAQLAWDTIERKHTKGIPIWEYMTMEWTMIDRLADVPEGSYEQDPMNTYREMFINGAVCMVDQWIPTNPLSIGARGYESDAEHGNTTGATHIVADGIEIVEPEHVCEHMEKFVFPELRKAIERFSEDEAVSGMLEHERTVQEEMGPTMLKTPYMQLAALPGFSYGTYGYVNYFMAYALYPEVMEKHFSLSADLATLKNRAGARAITEGGLAKYIRLDHDMADSRGTLVGIKTLDELWFPHFARCIQPLLDADVTLIWHCDGNLSEMVPRLLECGLRGFQGFQYEDGMDYEKICKMRDRDGNELLIIGGVSVTTTLPRGTPEDVRRQITWLVANGPETGLFLGGSSSITPGVPWENLKMLRDGFKYYRENGRG